MKARGKVAVAAGMLLSVSLMAGVAGAEPEEETPGSSQQVVSQEQRGVQEAQVQEARSEAAPQDVQEARSDAAPESGGGTAPENAEEPRQEAEAQGSDREAGEESREPEDVEPALGDGPVEEPGDGADSPDESAGPGGGGASDAATGAAAERVEQRARAGRGSGEQSLQRSSSGSFSDTGSGIPPERAVEIEARIQDLVQQVQEMREEAEARRQNAGEPRERPANGGGGQSEGARGEAGGAESQTAPSPAANGPAPGRGDGPGAGAAEPRERAGGAGGGERPAASSAGRAAAAEPEAEARLRELRAEARAGELPQPATGGSSADRQRELGIARGQIMARPVDEIPLREYEELYKEAAEEYGFEDDWYILAAVGKVESDHGQNLGPSSAGALGPMQFMPSTWEEFAVDGNGDGTKNIMDPEDAIPAAARYLSKSGAPEDWYAALFTYNRADWYVKKVLGVAEGYRQLAEDDSVGPYNRISSNR